MRPSVGSVQAFRDHLRNFLRHAFENDSKRPFLLERQGIVDQLARGLGAFSLDLQATQLSSENAWRWK